MKVTIVLKDGTRLEGKWTLKHQFLEGLLSYCFDVTDGPDAEAIGKRVIIPIASISYWFGHK